MTRYEPGTPRALFGVVAVGLSAAMLAVAVAGPAAMDCSTREISVLTRSDTIAPVLGAMNSINVVAVRGTRVIPVVHGPANPWKHRLEG